ncbi:hypothetical protein Zm00014a_014060, partial [Zea mays]
VTDPEIFESLGKYSTHTIKYSFV